MFRVDRVFLNPDDLEVWDNEPGGTVVRRFQEDGVKYVEVEFKNSPGETYIYLAEETNG